MRNNSTAFKSLDKVIKKTRVHFYKPIQIAEILYHHRINRNFDLSDLEFYRNRSKQWRDEISQRLIGKKCTSSAKFQDNIFEKNAMPPELLAELGQMNHETGEIEAYIYNAFKEKLTCLYEIGNYIENSSAKTFSILELIRFFKQEPGLARSLDKVYEIIVYALFSTIIKSLRAQVTLEILNKDIEVLRDFESFIEMVLGINASNTKLTLPAKLYRVGVTNAADSGLDMWANFGPIVQVKHLTLDPTKIEDIIEGIQADRIVIVCLDSEKKSIETLLRQVGWGERIQGIITIKDLDRWYKLCLSEKHIDKLGLTLLKDLHREFKAEFPSSKEIEPFLVERGYLHTVQING